MWRKLANETAEEQKVAQADVVLQSALWKPVRKEWDAPITEMTE